MDSIRSRRHRTVRSVIVLRDELYGASVPREIGSACRKLAALAAIDLLGATFSNPK